MLAWLCLAATIAYISRNGIAVAESTIRKDLELTEQQMGWIMSAFFSAYAVGQIPIGWLGNRWGSRRTLPVISVCWSAATFAMSLAAAPLALIAAQIGNGTSQAGLFPSSVNTISKWFPAARRALPSGALGSFMSVGAVIGAALAGVLVTRIGWRGMFVVFSVPGVLWAVAFYAWFRDLPRQHAAVNAEELALIGSDSDDDRQRPGEPTPWLAMFTSPAMWWIGGQQFFRAAGYIFFASWFPTYLQQSRGVSIQGSGLLTSLPLLGVVLGSLVGGAVSDWVLARSGNRRLARQGVATVAMLVCAAFIFAALLIEDAIFAVAIISAGSFCAAIGGPSAYVTTMDMGGRHVATVFATMNMAGNIGATIFPTVAAWLHSTTGSWDSVLLLFGAMYVGAAACWLLLKPKGTIFDQSLMPLKTKDQGR